MATTRKLVHSVSNVTIKDNETINSDDHGDVKVKSILQPRKKRGSGRVRVTLPDGRTVDVHPGHVKGKWV